MAANKKIVKNSAAELSDDDYKLWIHCNVCYEQFVKKLHPFYLVSCNHILCEACLKKMKCYRGETPGSPKTYQCSKCSKRVRAIQIGNSMPPNIKALFHPRCYEDDLPMSRILSFQEYHRQHLLEGFAKLSRKVDVLSVNFETEKKLLKKDIEHCGNLRIECNRLERRVRQIIVKRDKEMEEIENKAVHQPNRDAIVVDSDESSLFWPRREPFGTASNQRPIRSYERAIPIKQDDFEVASFTQKHNRSFNL